MRQLIKCVALAAALAGCGSTRSAVKADAQPGGIQGCMDLLVGRGTAVVLARLGDPIRSIQAGDEVIYRYLPEQLLHPEPSDSGKGPSCAVAATADPAAPTPQVEGTIEVVFQRGYVTSWRVSSSR
jgi:hypothetical protein